MNPRPMYFSQVRIDPNSPDRVYLGGVGMWMTIDGGRNFEQDAAFATHDDVHAIWIDPNNSDHLLIGNDGGLLAAPVPVNALTLGPGERADVVGLGRQATTSSRSRSASRASCA